MASSPNSVTKLFEIWDMRRGVCAMIFYTDYSIIWNAIVTDIRNIDFIKDILQYVIIVVMSIANFIKDMLQM